MWLCRGGYGGLHEQSLYLYFASIKITHTALSILIQVCSHLSHPGVLFHFGHGSEQAWRGRGRRDLQDAAEVGGVYGGLLRVEQ